MPEQRMSAHLTRLAKKRGRLPALVTALSLGALLALQQFLSSVSSYLYSLGFLAGTDNSDLDYVYSFTPTLEDLLFLILPLALGVFLALWAIAPISHELTLRFVLTRAALASAAGVLLVLVARLVKGLVESVGAATPIIGNQAFDPYPASAPPGVNFTVLATNSLEAVTSAFQVFVFYTPTVLLACVLLWLWLRDHPRDYEVAGLVDEL